jgi:hypothetical protein
MTYAIDEYWLLLRALRNMCVLITTRTNTARYSHSRPKLHLGHRNEVTPHAWSVVSSPQRTVPMSRGHCLFLTLSGDLLNNVYLFTVENLHFIGVKRRHRYKQVLETKKYADRTYDLSASAQV